MTLKITRVDKTLPSPKYATAGSVAFDLYARVEIKISAKTVALIPSNLIIKTPRGYMLLITARSSTPLKKGLMLANGIGVIDQDYCGENDEIHVQMYNFTNATVTIKKEERIAQAIIVKIAKAEFEEMPKARAQSRGGFGSTG
jgi:dUTP pyrophosphatase